MKHIVLCGGAGTRLWPLSNAKEPKQLLKLFQGKSLMQTCLERNASLTKEVLIIANQSLQIPTQTQVEELKFENRVSYLWEPQARNTAAAIAMSALLSQPDEILLVTPADHLISEDNKYQDTIIEAQKLATEGFLVTIGLKPAYPETGFGYIEHHGNEVIRFTEKPEKELAEQFIASGNYLWNSGIFCFSAQAIIQELKQHAPAILAEAEQTVKEYNQTGTISLEAMLNIPSHSIDYAIMEKTNKIKVVPSSMSWQDVGSYEALIAHLEPKAFSNKTIQINCLTDTNFVFPSHKPIALVGIENLIVVDSPQGLLILNKGLGQNIKEVHQEIKKHYPEFS